MNANPNLFTSSASSATAMRQNAEEEEQCVLHDYHDHANDSAETMTSREMLLFTPTGISNIVDNHQTMNGQIPFPLKLHTLLEDVENDPILSSVIAWQPHGRCFIVRKVTEFVNMILQRYVQNVLHTTCSSYNPYCSEDTNPHNRFIRLISAVDFVRQNSRLFSGN